MASSSSSHCENLTHRHLFRAALTGNLKQLVEVLNKGGLASDLMEVKDSSGLCALHFGAIGGKTQVCKYLVEQLKLDIDVQDDMGSTPLHLAIVNEQYLTSAYLLNQGAQPNMSTHKGKTALHYAAEKGRKDLLRLLISKGAKVDAQSIMGTPLQCAAADGRKDAVKFLLDNHANPNSVNGHMYTALLFAISAKSADCVRLLLKAGADPNLTSSGVTPLILAASEGETEIIKCLLQAGADANVTSFYNFTPIEVAAVGGNLADVGVLFPATTRIQGIPDWSCLGILEYVNSNEFTIQRMPKMEEKFLEAKENGAQAFRNSDYFNAIHWYSMAILAKPLDATLFSNRSLCWARLDEGNYALWDAFSCIMLRKDWPKAYYRAGVAWHILQDYKRAAEAFKMGLMLDPLNKELQDAYKDAMEDFQREHPGESVCLFSDGYDSDDDDDDDEDDDDDSDDDDDEEDDGEDNDIFELISLLSFLH